MEIIRYVLRDVCLAFFGLVFRKNPGFPKRLLDS